MNTQVAGPMTRSSVGASPRSKNLRGWIAALACVTVLLAAAAPARAVCNDGDGDGYGAPGDSDCPNGAATDCNDGNPSINPGAVELCNGVDDNCVNGVDEGFTFETVDIDTNSATVGQIVPLPLGALCADGAGLCRAEGVVACSPDGLSAFCDAPVGAPEQEGPPGDPSCYDLLDNDCDEDEDHDDLDCQGPEICDGADNDANGQTDETFPTLGDSCTIGQGVCETTGTVRCLADGSGVFCDAFAAPPIPEGPPGNPKCSDGLDNDCDGDTDLADADCLEPEKCDGIDNDNNGEVDETFANLGDPCSIGLGACAADGVFICSADGTGTVCNAAPSLGTPEGPIGPTCNDGIDNDCDGAIDANDPGCGGAGLVATCALQPSICRDCIGWYTVDFDAVSAAGTPDVTAEILALKSDGEVFATTPVEDGDVVYLGAVTYDDDCLVAETSGGVHKIFAAVPLLRVTAKDGLAESFAFCSNTPYLEVVEPSGQTITESAGDVTPVLVAVPLVDPATLQIIVDGVDIVAAMGLNPATDFPGGPFDDTFNLNAKSVTVSELIVRTAEPGDPTSNTVSFNIQGLGCGGHIVRVDGERLPGALKEPIPAWCHLDDLNDKGDSAGFGIDMFTPLAGEVTPGGPTHVTGEVCHGKNIAEVIVNGLSIDPTGNVNCTPGDGEDVGDLCLYDIDEMMPEMDYRQFVDTGDPQVGSFLQGANRLIVQATDEEFNATFDTRIFAVGPVLAAPSPLLRNGVTVTNAFNIGISEQGLDDFFESFNIAIRPLLKEKLEEQLEGFTTEKTISEDDIGCCSPTVDILVHDVTIDPENYAITVTPEQDQIVVRIVLPEFTFETDVAGRCCSGGCGFFCWCARKIDTTVLVRGTDITMSFIITEDIVKGNAPLESIVLESGSYVVAGTIRENGSAKCGFSLFSILTLGIKDAIEAIIGAFVDLVVPEDFYESGEIEQQIVELDGDFGEFEEFSFDNDEELPQSDLKLEFALGDVSITPQGIAAGVDATFIPLVLDPEAADIPGTPLTPAPLPEPPLTDTGGNPAKGITVTVSDDVFNQLLSGLTKTGQLKSTFEHTTTIESFLTEDCDSLPDNFPLFRRARCIGRTNVGNETICEDTYPLPILDAGKRNACLDEQEKYEQRLLIPGTDVVTRVRVDIPPKIFLDDDPATANSVECLFHYDEVSVSIVADRDGNPGLQGEPGTFPACFGADPSTVTECALWEACLDLQARMALERGTFTTEEGQQVPSIRVVFDSLSYEISVGRVCGGTTDIETDDVIAGTFESPLLDFLTEKLRDNTPELASTGLNFGGHATFSVDAELIALDNSAANDFADYIGITADIIHESPHFDPPDMALFMECLGGPTQLLRSTDCRAADLDENGRVDLLDYGMYQKMIEPAGN